MAIDLGIITTWIGDKLSLVVSWVIKQLENLFKLESGVLPEKLLTLFIIALIVLLLATILKKTAKIVTIVVGIILIISILVSIFV